VIYVIIAGVLVAAWILFCALAPPETDAPPPKPPPDWDAP
jgi:hypothetical protein